MWPFGRSRRRSASPSDTIVQASAEPAVDGWAGVPPLQRSLAPIDRTAEYDSFGDALSSWQAPPLAIAPLGHELSADAASGVVSDIAAPAARPAPMPAEPPSRRAAPPVSVQRSRASGDPDLALATRLGTSGSEPAWRSVWSGRPPDPALGRVTVRSGDATTSDAAAFEGVHSPGVAPVEPSLRETGHTASSPEPSRGPMTTAPGPGLPLMHLAAVQRSAADAFEIDLADAADVSTASSAEGTDMPDVGGEPREDAAMGDAPIIGLSEALPQTTPAPMPALGVDDPAPKDPRPSEPPARRLGLGPPIEPHMPGRAVQRAATPEPAPAAPVKPDAFGIPLAAGVQRASHGPSTAAPAVQRASDGPAATAQPVRPNAVARPSPASAPATGGLDLVRPAGSLPTPSPGAEVPPGTDSAPVTPAGPGTEKTGGADRFTPEAIAPLASLRPLQTSIVEPIWPQAVPTAPGHVGEAMPIQRRTAEAVPIRHGVPDAVPVRRDPEVSTAARGLGARAFTSHAEVFLPSEHGPIDREPARSLLAHELVHVQQQAELGGWRSPESSPAGIALEGQARGAEVRVSRLSEPATPGEPLPLASAPPREPDTTLQAFGPAVTALSPPSSDGASTTVMTFPGATATPVTEDASIASARVQRAEEAGAAPAVGAPAGGAPAATGGGSAVPGNLDALAERLYPRLSFYLKQELRLDRERFGVLTDVRD